MLPQNLLKTKKNLQLVLTMITMMKTSSTNLSIRRVKLRFHLFFRIRSEFNIISRNHYKNNKRQGLQMAVDSRCRMMMRSPQQGRAKQEQAQEDFHYQLMMNSRILKDQLIIQSLLPRRKVKQMVDFNYQQMTKNPTKNPDYPTQKNPLNLAVVSNYQTMTKSQFRIIMIEKK